MIKKFLSIVMVMTILVVGMIGGTTTTSAVESTILPNYGAFTYQLDNNPLLLGDINADGMVRINDCTLLQRYIALFYNVNLNNICIGLADANGDGQISISDATTIQRKLAEYDEDASVGSSIGEFKDDWSERVLKLVNEERAKVNKPALVMKEELVLPAKVRALEIEISDGTFSHQRPDGSMCLTAGSFLPIYALGENIAKGYTSPEDVVAAWMDSQGHRENILSGDFDSIGIACVKIENRNSWNAYGWVQFFGRFERPQ